MRRRLVKTAPRGSSEFRSGAGEGWNRTADGLRTCNPSDAPSETVTDNAAYRGFIKGVEVEICIGETVSRRNRAGD